MSRMSELYQEIVEMLEKGNHPSMISLMLDVPVSMVYDALEHLEGNTEVFSPFDTVNS